jgi:hypothetical protein
MTPKKKAELFLTVGRILTVLGVLLAAIPLLFAIPGLVLLVLGRSSFYIGEDLWNDCHNMSTFVGRRFRNGDVAIFGSSVGKSIE